MTIRSKQFEDAVQKLLDTLNLSYMRVSNYRCFKCGQVQNSPAKGWTDKFIYPPYEFKIVDKLLTNFHLPESTLIMLVSAFSSLEQIKNAYHQAVEEKYRFFSYGDSMLIL